MGGGRWGDVGQMRKTIVNIFQGVKTLRHPPVEVHFMSDWNVQGQSSCENFA